MGELSVLFTGLQLREVFAACADRLAAGIVAGLVSGAWPPPTPRRAAVSGRWFARSATRKGGDGRRSEPVKEKIKICTNPWARDPLDLGVASRCLDERQSS